MSTAGYRRSAGSARGEARRRDLLDRVTEDLAAHGLVDFSLRRAAAAAGTTHKVMLYHFDSVQDLLTQAVLQLRRRRVDQSLAAATTIGTDRPLAERVRALWPVLIGPEAWVLDQAIGLAMFDADKYSQLAREASLEYLPALESLCPEHWDPQRTREIAQLILAVLRGFLVEWRTSGDADGIEAGFRALLRALEREQEAP